MYLVDTSVWVEYIRGTDGASVHFLDDLLANPGSVGINDQIYLEILQGARSEAGFNKLRRYFSTQRIYRFEDQQSSYEAAAFVYFQCRRKGITIRSSIDCLIAQCALEHGLVLLHQDRDFAKLESVMPKLKQKHFLS